MGNTVGRFVWFDLMTPDAQGAKSFYADLVGWKAQAWQGSDYEMWFAQDAMVGGIMKPAKGVPPHWLGYVATDDVDASVQRAQRLGGRVLQPAQDIGDVGRWALLADPQGAAIALYQARNPGPGPDREKLGHFSWGELNTTDWKSAWKFYGELFGWKKTSSMDMGNGMGEYFMFSTDGQTSMGGMSDAAKAMKAPPHWLHYINVKSVDEACKRIPQLGGQVLNGPMDVPGNDRVAQALDPQGAAFAIYSHG